MQVDQLAGCAVQREGMEDAGMASPRARDGGSEAASRKGGVDLRIAARIDEKVDVLPSSKRGSEAYVALPVAVADAEFLQAIEEVTDRSEEHTSELQSLMRISSAVYCLKKNINPD